jgi:YesN/AraC family two-component response regulator
MVGSATKTLVDHNTLMAHHLVQMEKEMKVTVMAHNLKYINILINTAVTAEEKEFSQWCYKNHMQIEIDALRDHFNKNKEAMARTGTSVKSTANFAATPSNDDNDMVEYQDDETNFKFTPMEEMYNALEGDSNTSEFMQSSSYSGQFSPSEPHGDFDVVSELITTALTEVYEGESVTSRCHKTRCAISLLLAPILPELCDQFYLSRWSLVLTGDDRAKLLHRYLLRSNHL